MLVEIKAVRAPRGAKPDLSTVSWRKVLLKGDPTVPFGAVYGYLSTRLRCLTEEAVADRITEPF